MPSPFDEIDAAMQAAIDDKFGEGVRVTPMKVGEYSGAPDPDRPVREIVATVARASKAEATDYSGSMQDGAAISQPAAELWISAAAYAALGYEIRRNDIVDLIEPPEARFEVAAVHPAGAGDVQIILG